MSRIKSFTTVNSIFFNGSQQQQIVSAYGVELSLTDGMFIIAKPPASSGRETLHIPMSNVKCIVMIDEDAEAAKQLEAEARIRLAATVEAKQAKAPVSLLKGTVKFVKNKDTGAIEEVMV